MTRGFEHRLWGYTVVRIEPPDIERGVVSDSTPSARPPSPNTSLDGQEMDDYSKLGVVDVPNKDPPAQDDEPHTDRKKDESSAFENGDLAVRPVLQSTRESSEEMDERESGSGWHIPETVILTSESRGPF